MAERKYRSDWCSRSQGIRCYQRIEEEKPVQNSKKLDSRTLKTDEPEKTQEIENILYETWIKLKNLISR